MIASVEASQYSVSSTVGSDDEDSDDEDSDDEDSDDEEHDATNNSVTNKASQTFTKSPLHRIANGN